MIDYIENPHRKCAAGIFSAITDLFLQNFSVHAKVVLLDGLAKLFNRTVLCLLSARTYVFKKFASTCHRKQVKYTGFHTMTGKYPLLLLRSADLHFIEAVLIDSVL